MQRSLSALFLLLLSACGTTPTPEPTVGAGRLTAATPSSTFAQRVLDLTNAARAQARTCGSTPYGATGPLTYNLKLEASAVAHARDMAANNYFSHTSVDGRTFDQRITASGYMWSIVAENIAAGQVTPQEVVQAWLDSAGHCADIMAPDITEIGIGYTPVSSGTYGTYWVQDFGTPK
ncbi:CAP domain-containing protein [Deinococcus sp.]|uniref:CAP domain-containing protein n=1 Tax=Deinococcus sp. TaxID=47478 RepID=UPI002869E39E|nr:CAP domain-containing protein [Deinococcus sp.]